VTPPLHHTSQTVNRGIKDCSANRGNRSCVGLVREFTGSTPPVQLELRADCLSTGDGVSDF